MWLTLWLFWLIASVMIAVESSTNFENAMCTNKDDSTYQLSVTEKQNADVRTTLADMAKENTKTLYHLVQPTTDKLPKLLLFSLTCNPDKMLVYCTYICRSTFGGKGIAWKIIFLEPVKAGTTASFKCAGDDITLSCDAKLENGAEVVKEQNRQSAGSKIRSKFHEY